MRDIIIAKLIKDLPDVKAGALFTSLSRAHWKEIYPDTPYNHNLLFYFNNDEHDLSLIDDPDIWSYYSIENLKDWCLFFDYSTGKFTEYDKACALTLRVVEYVNNE